MAAEAYVPLLFAQGEAYQFDWSHEIVLLAGVTVTLMVAHVRFCHSRMMFVRAFPRGTQEMVFDAQDGAFAFFGGACTRGISVNMKTAVETVFAGKDRQYNRRFLQMCSHYLVQPVACTPASGWEKGQVENQVGLVRERFFTPRLRFQNYEELNAWLLDTCVAYARAHHHVDQPERMIWDVFEEQRGKLVEYRGPFDGIHTVPPRCRRPAPCASTTTSTWCSRPRSAGPSRSRPMPVASSSVRTVWSWASIPARSADQMVYNPWHYVPVLARKPGALRNGATFRGWELPRGMERVRRR